MRKVALLLAMFSLAPVFAANTTSYLTWNDLVKFVAVFSAVHYVLAGLGGIVAGLMSGNLAVAVGSLIGALIAAVITYLIALLTVKIVQHI